MITLGRLQRTNVKRALRWHASGLEEWSALEWAGAMAGEVGEACNAAKKFKRAETGMKNIDKRKTGRLSAKRQLEAYRKQVGEEVADAIIYGVLLAARVGVDIEDAVRRKFNKTSKEYRVPERL